MVFSLWIHFVRNWSTIWVVLSRMVMEWWSPEQDIVNTVPRNTLCLYTIPCNKGPPEIFSFNQLVLYCYYKVYQTSLTHIVHCDLECGDSQILSMTEPPRGERGEGRADWTALIVNIKNWRLTSLCSTNPVLWYQRNMILQFRITRGQSPARQPHSQLNISF